MKYLLLRNKLFIKIIYKDVAKLHNGSKRNKGGDSDPRTKVYFKNWFKKTWYLQNYIFIKKYYEKYYIECMQMYVTSNVGCYQY